MKISTNKALLACLLVSIVNSANASENLGDITVTATKTERKISDVPASIEVITQETIKKTSANTVNELLANISGLDVRSNSSIISNSEAGTNKVLMRGFGGTARGRVLVMVDGVAMNDAMSQNVEWNKIAMGDVERIEVVKGANSALYGSSAMGGVINIITKKPKAQTTDISLTYGSMNTKIIALSTGGKVNNLGYYLSGTKTTSDGYIKELPQNIKTTTIKTGIKRDNLVAKFTYDIDNVTDMYLNINKFDNLQTGEKNIPGYDAFHQKDTSIKTGYKTQINNNIDVLFNIYNTDENRSYDSTSTTAVTSTTTIDLKRLGGGVQATIPSFDDTHYITTGIDIRYDELDNKSNYVATGKVIQNLGKQDYLALFVQDEIFLGEKTVINIGGRYDKYNNHDGSQYDSSLTTTNYNSKKFSAFSPKIGAIYNISDRLSVRGSAGKAFRVPTLYELYSTFVGSKTWYSNPNLEPEKVISYEAGFDYKLYERANWSVTTYKSDAKDFIYSATRPDGHYDKVNVGEVEIKGIETELFLPINDTLDFMVNYTYNKSKIKKFETNTALEGNYLTLIPKKKASASIIYTNPKLINITGSVRYIGDRYQDDANTESTAYQGYTLYDLKLSKNITENTEFSLNIEDLFDKGYTETYVSPGRVTMATVKMSF
ncbi:MAG: TonB-dependent receptor [Arcobacteraceae bacterium]|jgi:iron complex outermembrane receptor protein|nr:TonB-dependent receptor [Arcobacteraceae bacterium]